MRKKKIVIILTSLLGCLIILIGGSILLYNFLLNPVSTDDDWVDFTIESGESMRDVIENLYNARIIKNKYAALIHVKIHKNVVQAGDYHLNRAMPTMDILKVFSNGRYSNDVVNITFIEGLRLTDYVEDASKLLGFDYDEALKRIDSEEYLKGLIDSGKYWFLTDKILDKNIYHGLEGYLFADTYQFAKNSSIDDVINVMLTNMANKLEPFKERIINNDLSIHEILTLASIVEGEGRTEESRGRIAQVFLNRIALGMTLGSDVTTRYALGLATTDPLSMDDLNSCDNSYNTRCANVKLSIGPISTPSLMSIKAVIEPIANEDLYFVADCSGKVYYSKTEAEHYQTVNKLKAENNWCDS